MLEVPTVKLEIQPLKLAFPTSNFSLGSFKKNMALISIFFINILLFFEAFIYTNRNQSHARLFLLKHIAGHPFVCFNRKKKTLKKRQEMFLNRYVAFHLKFKKRK